MCTVFGVAPVLRDCLMHFWHWMVLGRESSGTVGQKIVALGAHETPSVAPSIRFLPGLVVVQEAGRTTAIEVGEEVCRLVPIFQCNRASPGLLRE
jgi:hypothetical protein